MRVLSLISLFLVVILINFSFGQDLEALEKKLNDFGTQENTRSWYENNFLLDMKLSAGSEFMLFSRNEFGIIQNGLDTMYWQERPFLTTIASFSLEPRMNLVRLKNGNIFFIKAPTGLGLSITSRSTYRRSRGVFHFNTGILLGIGSGFHSTKSNIESNGLAVSIGFQYLRAPILGHKIRNEYLFGSQSFGDQLELLEKPRKNWILPTLQVDLYYLNKSNKPRGFSLTVGAFRSFYAKLAMTILDKAD